MLGGARVLESVSLTVPPGSVIGIAGPNGSGKTTLLRLVATLIRARSGSVEILGWDGSATPPPAVRERIGYVGHSPALNGELSLAENLGFLAGLARSDVGPAEALAMVGIDSVAARPAKLASEGMRRRADLARLLLYQPDLLLLDEPYAGLDTGAAAIVGALIERTTTRGGAAVVVSHDRNRLDGFDQVISLGVNGA